MECSLCKEDVSVGPALKKRKKLCGDRAQVARDQLQEFCWQELGAGVEEIVGKSAYLCASCDSQLCRFSKLKQDLESLRRTISTKVCSLSTSISYIDEVDEVDASLGVEVAGTPDYVDASSISGVDASSIDASSVDASSHDQTPVCTSRVSPAKTVDDGDDGIDEAESNRVSPQVKVNVNYQCGDKNYQIRTPWRKKAVRRLARKTDTTFNSAPLSSGAGRKAAIKAVAGAVRLSLVQRAITVALYGNGAHKAVYSCLQTLMICYSPSGTTELIDRLCQDHDIEVKFWGDQMKETHGEHLDCRDLLEGIGLRDLLDDEESVNSEESIEAPVFSSMSEAESDTESELSDGDSTSSSLDQDSTSASPSMTITPTPATGDSVVLYTSGGWKGFKLVGDNVDKNVRASYQRIGRSTQSLHYFHCYAVLDRVDFSGLSDLPPPASIVDPLSFLPTDADIAMVERDIEVLMSRILVQHSVKYRTQAQHVDWHITHKYSTEMAAKSVVVPIGIFLHNENVNHEMCKILDELHEYVPSTTTSSEVMLDDGESVTYIDYQLTKLLLGGDQLTVARVHSAKGIRANHEDSKSCLKGIIPVTEDWHTRMTLMQSIWVHHYHDVSSLDRGTLPQLKVLINRTSVPRKPGDNMKAAEDFLEVVLHAHVMAAANSIPNNNRMSVHEMAQKIVRTFVKLEVGVGSSNTDGETGSSDMDGSDRDGEGSSDMDVEGSSNSDGVYMYACDLLTLGMIWMGFHDAIREGDGERVMVYWKFFLPIFKLLGRKNYCIEAIDIQLLRYHHLSERQAAQLVWSRFVNTHGRRGKNIPCDLHIEHLNRCLKDSIRNLKSNVKTKSVVRAAKAIGVVHHITKLFKEQTTHKRESGNHSIPSSGKDFQKILCELTSLKVFTPIPGRDHDSVHISKPLLQHFNQKKYLDWVKHHIY